MLAEAVAALGRVVDADSVPVTRVQLGHAGCLIDRGKRAEATALLEDVRRAMQDAGRAATSLGPMLRAVQEKLGTAVAR
jgi:hypothetical protein